MNRAITCGLTVALGSFALGAFADTQQVSTTIQQVVTKMPEKVDLPNGKVVMANGEWHGSAVNDKTGEQSSQWCTGEQYPDAKGTPMYGAGYCTIFYDNGDILWVSFMGNGEGKPGSWAVIGGTGRWEGATGGGKTDMVSQRSDGYAWTSKSTGTLTTK